MKSKTLFLLILSFVGSSAYSQVSQQAITQLQSSFRTQSFFDGHLTGFILYDLETKQVVFEKNSHQYQIPASTTKLLTLYAALVVLKDSTQTLRYQSAGDTLKIWGSGDPSWKYKNFSQPDLKKLIGKHRVVQFSDANLVAAPFGYGWQWDDYYYDYSAERSSLPIYGNLVEVTKSGNSIQLTPQIFQSKLKATNKLIKGVERDFYSNTYYYNANNFSGGEKYIPFKTEPQLFVELASKETGVTWIYKPAILPQKHQELRASALSPILKEMMLISDNFLAEQILLMVSDKLFKSLDDERAIDYLLKTNLSDLKDRPKWVDGSGLSRHNLITPRSLVGVVEKLQELLPQDQFNEFLAIGGKSGTLKNTFQAPEPYIFAKTGSMSHAYSLAGIVKTKSGKRYAFAFMNSNFPFAASTVRKEVEKVMIQVRDHF